MNLSFIIPALNEEVRLPFTIKSIHEFTPESLNYQIIVVDNGSTDNTIKIAKELGALVHIDTLASIAQLRNIGTEASDGEILVFIDSDVTLTPQWASSILKSLRLFDSNPMMITGSKCSVDEQASWIAETWFQSASISGPVTHLGTGHMITSRKLFDTVGGFNKGLQTGEDYEFCMKARKAKGIIVNNVDLKVIHHGVPLNLFEFVKREFWHGLGDTGSFLSIIQSKVMVAAIFFTILHLIAIAGIFYLENLYWLLIVFLLLITLCYFSTYRKSSNGRLLSRLKQSGLFYFYYVGRSLSLTCIVFPFVKSLKLRVKR